MSYPIKPLWMHEIMRLRPGMYVELPEEPAARVLGMVEQTLTRLASPRFANGASHVELHVWPGPAFELLDDGRGFPVDVISASGAPMSRLDRVMTEFHLAERLERGFEPEPDYQVWGPFACFGIILNALCSRVTIRTVRDGVPGEARYSRGGIIAPLHPSKRGPSRGTQVIFQIDPVLFAPAAQEQAAEKEGLEQLVSRYPSTTVQWAQEYPMGTFPDW